MEQPEQMPAPPLWGYALTLVAVTGAAVGAARHWPNHRPLIGSALAVLAVLALITGWLYRRKGYTFAEGFVSGLILWPLAAAYGLWGPRAASRQQSL